ADGDVGLDLFHAEHLNVAHQDGVPVVCSPHDLAVDPGVADLNERRRADVARVPHQLDGELVGHIDHVQQDAIAFLQIGRILDEQLRQFLATRIGHARIVSCQWSVVSSKTVWSGVSCWLFSRAGLSEKMPKGISSITRHFGWRSLSLGSRFSSPRLRSQSLLLCGGCGTIGGREQWPIESRSSRIPGPAGATT